MYCSVRFGYALFCNSLLHEPSADEASRKTIGLLVLHRGNHPTPLDLLSSPWGIHRAGKYPPPPPPSNTYHPSLLASARSLVQTVPNTFHVYRVHVCELLGCTALVHVASWTNTILSYSTPWVASGWTTASTAWERLAGLREKSLPWPRAPRLPWAASEVPWWWGVYICVSSFAVVKTSPLWVLSAWHDKRGARGTYCVCRACIVSYLILSYHIDRIVCYRIVLCVSIRTPRCTGLLLRRNLDAKSKYMMTTCVCVFVSFWCLRFKFALLAVNTPLVTLFQPYRNLTICTPPSLQLPVGQLAALAAFRRVDKEAPAARFTTFHAHIGAGKLGLGLVGRSRPRKTDVVI